MTELILALVCLAILVTMGVCEKTSNDKNVAKLDLRINVNGIRGKSTITRMTASVLDEAGYKVIAKTTGTAARMIYWKQADEYEIARGKRGANIVEQVRVIRQAVKMGANALVCECMAVEPQLQQVYSHEIIKANILVIANVLEDHLDVMGPTTDQIAIAFSRTIPQNGTVIVPQCEYTDFFIKEAKKYNARVVVADESKIPEGFLDKFNYLVFPNNCAIPLAIAEVLGIDRETALRGLLNAHPDPGAMQMTPIEYNGLHATVINAFAANEPQSTYEIWEKVVALDTYNTSHPIILLNCRPDRVDRSRQFAQDFLHKIPNATLVVAGENTHPIENAYCKGKLKNLAEYCNFERKDCNIIIAKLRGIMDGRVIFCVGNIHGDGEILLDMLEHGDNIKSIDETATADSGNNN